MRHERHFTVEQATAALGWVRERLDRMRDAAARLTDPEARAALEGAAPTNGGGAPGTLVGEAFVALRDAAAELSGAGVILRDLDRGLVDFPALRDGREVYLCWEDGEPAIGFWHELDAGHAGRQPL